MRVLSCQRLISDVWAVVFEMVHEFAAESKEMDEAGAKGNLDETKVQRGVDFSRFLAIKP